jgi:ribosomal-protein-alanine N-acetyltransferase
MAKKKQGYPFGIEEAATGRIIGGMFLHNISPTHRSGEIGYALNRRYWRQGYMSEAVRLICRFAFRELKLNRVWATVIVPNTASAELLFKLGFTLEGTLRQGMRVRGRYYDVHVFGLLQSEFRSR